MKPERLKNIIRNGGTAFGPNLQIPSPALVEIIALAGFQYILLDGEHGSAYSSMESMILAARSAGISPVVRVPSHDRAWILPPLEMGADGVQVPMVNTADQARELVREVKYGPVGGRGFSGVTRSAGYGTVPLLDQSRLGNESVMLTVQLETVEAMQNARAIAQVEGVDMIFIGPADLAQSLGLPGRMQSVEVDRAIEQIIADVQEFVPVSTVALSAGDVAKWKAMGVRCFLTSSVHPIRKAFEGMLEELSSGA